MEDKKTLITIIVLLAIFLPAAVLGTYRHITNASSGNELIDDNPNHDLIYNNRVYFYLNEELLATYDCVTCSKSVTTLDDEVYHINYYANGTYELPAVLNTSVALINENGTDYMYSLAANRLLNGFDAIKDYKIEHTEPLLIANSGGMWGALSLTSNALNVAINYEYDYIGIPAHLVNGLLDTSKVIAKQGDNWFILNNDGTNDYQPFTSEVVDFNDNYYVTYDGEYHIYNYNNEEYLTTIEKMEVYAQGEYLFIVSPTNTLLVYTEATRSPLTTITLPEYENLYFNQTTSGIEILINGNLYQTIENT